MRWSVIDIVTFLVNSRGLGTFENCLWIMESKSGALRCLLRAVMHIWSQGCVKILPEFVKSKFNTLEKNAEREPLKNHRILKINF